MKTLIMFFIVASYAVAAQSAGNNSTKKLYSVNAGASTLTIYKSTSQTEPFQVIVNSNAEKVRQFYVITYQSDIFRYLLVEKLKDTYVYYPLVWESLESITVKEIKDRCSLILKGKIAAVEKTDL